MNVFFFVLDAFSKWPFVHIVKDITTKTTIHACKKIFLEFGVPKVIVMDNGRNFRSAEFGHFLKTNGIIPKFTAPYHPATNGQAERFIQTMKNALRKMLKDPTNRNLKLEDALHNFLVQYKVTPHCITGVTTSEKMFNRQIRTYYTVCLPSKEKEFIVTNENKKFREFAVGENVQCRNYSGGAKWKHGRVTHRIGKLHYKVKLDDGRTWERHADQILRSGDHWDYPKEPLTEADPYVPEVQDEAEIPQPEPEEVRQPLEEAEAPALVAARPGERPVRTRKPPARYANFVCNRK